MNNQWGSMSPSDYMEQRVDDQLDWYSKKSALNKRWHYRLQLITIVAAALVPVISLSSAQDFVRLVVAVVGSIAAITAGAVALYQFRDRWVDYRSAAEQIKYEKYLYLTGSSPYTNKDSFSQFVLKIEGIIVSENSGWVEKQKPPSEDRSEQADTAAGHHDHQQEETESDS